MKHLLPSLLFAVVLTASLAVAQNPPPAAQPAVSTPAQPAVIGNAKIAWMSLQQAIFNCDEGKEEFGKIQQFVETSNAKLQNLKKEDDSLKNQLQVQGSKLTDDARAELEEKIESKDTELTRFQQDTQKEIDNRRVKITNYIGRKMLPIIEKIAKDKGVSAVLYIDPQRDGWIDPNLIITDEVIKAYNAAYPSGAAAKKP
jgi:Skp family chaperone for outer membrane proteins